MSGFSRVGAPDTLRKEREKEEGKQKWACPIHVSAICPHSSDNPARGYLRKLFLPGILNVPYRLGRYVGYVTDAAATPRFRGMV